MAFAVRMTGLKSIYDADGDGGKSDFEIEPSWWSTDELKQDKRFVQTRDLGSYYDHTADLNLAEIRVLHGKYNASEATAYDGRLQAIDAELESVLDSGKFVVFRVCVFEWESGY
ncbi:MAG: hypothetical protein WCQ50_18355 [Spirochaetota bacterium]